MLTKITIFFNSLLQTSDEKHLVQLSPELACAVLLCEVMRADGHISNAEQDKLNQILNQHFLLTDAESTELLQKANRLSKNATDFYQFTSKITQYYSLDQRIIMVELLWQVALADGELANIEEHIIRKIADLLHLNHTEYIQTKLRVKK